LRTATNHEIVLRGIFATMLGLLCLAWPRAAVLSNPSVGSIRHELNALKPVDGGCQVVFVLKNGLDRELNSLGLELVLINLEQIMDRMLRIKTKPVPASATKVQVFKVDGLDCGSLGSLLTKGASGCAAASNAGPSCQEVPAVSHRMAIPLSR